MSTDPEALLQAIAAQERELEEGYLQRIEAYLRGDRSREELLAECETEEEREELEELLSGVRPLDEERRTALVDRLLESMAQPADHEAEAAPVDLDAERASRRRTLVGAVLVLAAVAALVLWLRPAPPPEVDEAPRLAQVQLPPFSFVVRDQPLQTIRGDHDTPAVARYQQRSTIHWVLTPERAVEAPLGLSILVEQGGERRLLSPAGTRPSPRGALELQGPVSRVLSLPPGQYQLRFVVGARDGLPTSIEALDRGGPWQVLDASYSIEIVP